MFYRVYTAYVVLSIMLAMLQGYGLLIFCGLLWILFFIA